MTPGAASPSVVTAAPRPFLFRRPLADLWLRPWFDWYGLRFISRYFFPVSRGWAEATQAGCTASRFRERFELARKDSEGLDAAIASVGEAERRYTERLDLWQRGFFGAAELPPPALVSLEVERARAALSFMAQRRLFGPWRRALPPATWEVASHELVAERHGARLAAIADAYPLSADAAVESSQAAPATWGTVSWLSFTSPVLGDRVTARVETPPPPRDGPQPTLLLLHGIAMEDEMWGIRPDPVDHLRAAGWRIVKPEGPWHGRRRLPGRYGGEPVIGQGLDGFLTLFQAWVTEAAVLLDWARRQGGPVVLGGISLGALTAQLIATQARAWPAALVPDALLLIATSGEVGATAYAGSLARALGMPERLAERGWMPDDLAPWLQLIEPGESAVPPERTVMLLGRVDSVTPYDGGSLLADRWQVPSRNVFRPWQGHFSVSVGLSVFTKPLERLRQVLQER